MEHELPIIDAARLQPVPTGEVDVAGILLAAGTSERFGTANKLLATIQGRPVVRHAAETLVEADLSPLIAVVGYDAEAVSAAIDGLDFEIIHNPEFREGQGTSVATGANTVAGRADAAVFALGDMPGVEPASVRALVQAYAAGEASAIAPASEGSRGNPVLFDARHFDALSKQSDDSGGREILLDGEDSLLIETGDPGVRTDVDTADDLREVRAILEERS